LGLALKLIYQEDLQDYFDLRDTPSRFKKYQERLVNLVGRLKTEDDDDSTAHRLQYFKDEPIITFYTFASIDKIYKTAAGKDIWRAIFSKAFQHSGTLDELDRLSSLKAKMTLEVPLPPTGTIRAKVTEWANNNPHPVKYIRDKFQTSRIEDPTMADVTLTFQDENPEASKPKAVMCFECKFMSDISHETTYHYARNQIARIIDVGWSLYPDGFYFVLVTPAIFKNGKSRFYCYKMGDYQTGNLEVLKQDLLLGADLTDKDLKTVSRKIGWVSWEDLVQAIFNFEGLAVDIPFEELKEFYGERKLFP
jgi:hypothetical protein